MSRLLLLLTILASAACSRGRGTPEATFETMRSAAATGDSELVYELHHRDAQAVSRQKVREMRARLERNDPPEEVLQGCGLTREEVETGTLADGAARLMARFSPLAVDAQWFANAKVVSVEPEHEDSVLLRARGTDGTERRLWLVKEGGRWAIDGMRSWRQER